MLINAYFWETEALNYNKGLSLLKVNENVIYSPEYLLAKNEINHANCIFFAMAQINVNS